MQQVHGNHDGLRAHEAQVFAARAPEPIHGIWPNPAPPAYIPQVNGLRNLAGRYFNNPEAVVNTLRIEPGPDGRFLVWIALDLADIF